MSSCIPSLRTDASAPSGRVASTSSLRTGVRDLRTRLGGLAAAHHVRIIAGLALVAMAFVPVLVYAMSSLDGVAKAETSLAAVYTRSMVLAQDLRSDRFVQDATMADFVLSGDPVILRRHEDASAEFARVLALLRATEPGQAVAAMLDRVAGIEARLQAIEGPGTRMRLAGASPEETDAYFRKEAVGLARQASTELDGVVRETTAEYEEDSASYGAMIRTVYDVLDCASVLTAVMCAALMRLTARALTRKRESDALAEGLARRERELSLARRDAVEMVAHDLRSPLSVVTLGSEMVRDRSGLGEGHKAIRYVDRVMQAAESMERMIGDILVNSRIESGTLAIRAEPVKVAPFAQGIARQFALLGGRGQVEVSADLSEAPDTVDMDAPRMGQVLSNLMGNAVKFSPKGGRVTLAVASSASHVEFRVTDQGPGMTADQARRVFERHWQAPGTASLGTGLGLSIARAITEAHGGTVSVVTAPGAGTTFVARLPLAARDGATD